MSENILSHLRRVVLQCIAHIKVHLRSQLGLYYDIDHIKTCQQAHVDC